MLISTTRLYERRIARPLVMNDRELLFFRFFWN
jgi:hypothetical protein